MFKLDARKTKSVMIISTEDWIEIVIDGVEFSIMAEHITKPERDIYYDEIVQFVESVAAARCEKPARRGRKSRGCSHREGSAGRRRRIDPSRV